MAIKIALAGNPNSGKTTMFNDLTGSNQYVGNWPGVTVEKKEGKLKGADDVLVQDLPGIYSLSPYTLEEVVARNYLVNEKPDAILNIVDATNIERNLYLTTQLLELGIPTVIALNMADVARKNGDAIHIEKLGAALHCQVVATSARKGEGTGEAAARAAAIARQGAPGTPPQVFAGSVASALDRIEQLIGRKAGGPARWHAVKLFERDPQVAQQLALPQATMAAIEAVVAGCEQALDDDAQSIITNQRYAYVGQLVAGCVKKGRAQGALSASDKIDQVVTSRVWGLPIFAAIMWLVYYVSVQTVGDLVTAFTNDVFVAQWVQGPVMAWLDGLGTAGWLVGLIGEGIIGGAGAVLGFVPQMLVLFLMLAILEDVGYMARVAFIMDRVFRKFGLSGKSFIPMLIASGCGVPGIMASRTIERDRDRKMTIMTATFIPCGAKMPIVALVAGALFGGSGLVSTAAYFIGVAAVIVSGVMLKKTKPFSGDPAPFVMELPAYHAPAAGNVLSSMGERGWSFVKRAGTVIVVASIFIWFASNYGWTQVQSARATFGQVEDADDSILGKVGSAVAPVFRPLGFGSWQSTVATVMGLVAKEEVVGVFGVLYGVTDAAGQDAVMGILEDEGLDGGERAALLSPIAGSFAQTSGGHGQLAAFSFLLFNLLCAPCFAAIGAIRREMNSGKWTWFAVGYQCAFAYGAAFMVYQLGLMFAAGFTALSAVAMALVALLAYLLLRKNKYDGTQFTRQAQAQA